VLGGWGAGWLGAGAGCWVLGAVPWVKSIFLPTK